MSRVLLLFFIIAFFGSITLILLDYLLGHRLLVPIAKMLKFKQDDVEKTEEKVNEIFGNKKDEKSKSKTGRTEKK